MKELEDHIVHLSTKFEALNKRDLKRQQQLRHSSSYQLSVNKSIQNMKCMLEESKKSSIVPAQRFSNKSLGSVQRLQQKLHEVDMNSPYGFKNTEDTRPKKEKSNLEVTQSKRCNSAMGAP